MGFEAFTPREVGKSTIAAGKEILKPVQSINTKNLLSVGAYADAGGSMAGELLKLGFTAPLKGIVHIGDGTIQQLGKLLGWTLKGAWNVAKSVPFLPAPAARD